MAVQILPAALAAKIAAGEVVERPASVVKELCENALDAQAAAVAVGIEQGGLRRIVVEDDGTGITSDELPLTVRRYATSKISSVADLAAIQTLGFRGEALASIAAVSHLHVRSRTAAERAAHLLTAVGGERTAAKPTAGPVGTAVDVQHLFFQRPGAARLLQEPPGGSATHHSMRAAPCAEPPCGALFTYSQWTGSIRSNRQRTHGGCLHRHARP